ncbi:MAG: hypothetical protein CVU64_05015 [Deltaproteobacteria bacterium HGW-Deltaproteobacteria-21]|nr:MAG: hypothetical protein CVU64_05015 [Deltaproteobacteria bacterium HGW-Deltaproteobacteria-21]
MKRNISRREFLKYTAAGSGILSLGVGGPAMAGQQSRVALVSTEDRKRGVAAAIAALRSNEAIMKPAIFEQEQIARAVELGLGASSSSEIDLVPADEASRRVTDTISQILRKG